MQAIMRFYTLSKAAIFTVASITLFGCSQQAETPSMPDSADSGAPITTNINIWPKLSQPRDPAVEERVEKLLATMTLEQKVGQMTQAEITFVKPEEVKELHLGSVLNGGDSFVHNDRNASIDDWVDYLDVLYDASMDTSNGGLPIPLTYGTDAVHGNSKFGFATIFPHNIGLGATRNPELMKRIGKVTAIEMLVPGVDWTFAPTVAIVRDDRWGRTYEGFGEHPEIAASFAGELVEGLQGEIDSDNFLGDDHAYATAKHWVGDGGTVNGMDQGHNLMSEEDLMNLQAAAYFPAIEAGVQSVMISHSTWHGERMHGHKYLITDVLKNRLGFDGFVVSDWNAHGNVRGCAADSCVQAVNAGIDMFMVTEDFRSFISNTVQQVNDGLIPMSRIDDAVRRILRVKFRSGLFDKGRPSSRPYAGKRELMGSPEHRAVAAQAVRESLVLLKNNGQTLPLAPKQRILVAGDGADNIGKQAGAWTISWQSLGNTNEDFPGATSVYDGIKSTVEAAGGEAVLSESGDFDEKPDAAIVVFGENPYAEWKGDLPGLTYKPDSSADYDLLQKLKQQDIPVIALYIGGRPLWMNREINSSDAFVAAWLPGSEGNAIADVLFANADGSVHHDFKGKLSYSWPKRASQNVLNVGDSDYDPLFAYGFGLTYSDQVELAKLDETNDFLLSGSSDAPYDIFTRGLAGDWQVFFDTGNGETFLNADLRNENEFVVIREADKNVQGDSFEAQITGKATTTVGVGSPSFRVNTQSYLDQGGVLSFEVRTTLAPEGKVEAVMRCPNGYCGSFDITPLLPSVESQEWATITIPLNCFANTGVLFDLNSSPFALQSDKAVGLRLTQIFYSSAPVAKPSITCN